MSKQKYLLVLLVVLLGILAFLLSSFVGDIKRFHRNGFYQIHRPATSADIGLVASWMTFNYLNKSFALPQEYLKTKLSISDPKYPNITISWAAKTEGIAAGVYLETVKTEISEYLGQSH